MANVTLDDVRQAVTALRAEGIDPSVEKIRLHLGSGDKGRGSPVTVTKFWKQIRDEEAGPAPEAPAELNPFEPGEAVIAAVRDNAQTFAMSVLRSLYSEVNEKFRPVRERIEQEKIEQAAANDTLIAEAQTARELAETLRGDLDRVRGELAAAEAVIQQRNSDAAEQRESIQALRHDLDATREQLAEARQDAAVARSALDALKEAHAGQQIEHRAAVTALTAERDQAVSDWKSSTATAGQMQERIGALSADLDEAKKQIAAGTVLQDRLRAEGAEQQQRLRAELDTAKAEAATLRGRLAAIDESAKADKSKSSAPIPRTAPSKRTKK